MGLAVVVGAKSVSSRPILLFDDEAAADEEAPPPNFGVENLVQEEDDSVSEDDDDHSAEVDEEEPALLQPFSLPLGSTDAVQLTAADCVATAVSSDQVLQAIASVSYYDMVAVEETDDDDDSDYSYDEDRIAYTVASLRIQIIPSTEALTSASSSSRYREAIHRIKLPSLSFDRTVGGSRDRRRTRRQQQKLDLVFSDDRKYLSCLVPHPTSSDDGGGGGTAVVFQLRRPRLSRSQKLQQQRQLPPPLPSYIQRTTSSSWSELSVPVVINPRIVPVRRRRTVITAIEDVTTSATSSSGPSILLAGCADGTILAVSYRPFVVAGSFFSPVAEEEPDRASSGEDQDDESTASYAVSYDETTSSNDEPAEVKTIRHLKHITEWNETKTGTTGRLVTIRDDGIVSIFRTFMVLASHVNDSHNDDYTESSFAAVDRDLTEVSSSSAALGRQQQQQQQQQRASLFAKGGAAALNAYSGSSLILTIQKEILILDCGACTYAEWISASYLAVLVLQDTGTIAHSSRSSKVQVWGIDGDGSSCVSTWDMSIDRLIENAHSTFAIDNVEAQREIVPGPSHTALHYDTYSDCLSISVSLAETDRESGMAHLRPFVCVWSWKCNVEGIVVVAAKSIQNYVLSDLLFCTDSTGTRKLAHLIIGCSDTSERTLTMRKEIYSASLLSSSHSENRRARVQRTNYLMVGSTSVSYPYVSRSSAKGDFDVEWQEAQIPFDYLQSRGSPLVAAIGERMGKSVAVASSCGFCSLLCGDKLSTDNYSRLRGERSLKQTYMPPRWYRFGNTAEEGSFRVVAMSWWEGTCVADDEDAVSDDILVCLIEIEAGKDAGYYLSCWAQRSFDLNHQLLHDGRSSLRGWGARLPHSFYPTSLDLFGNPRTVTSISDRKAVVMLSDRSPSTSFQVIQLSLESAKINASESYRESLPFFVRAHRCSSSAIGSPADLFIAGASFAFDLASDDIQSGTEANYVATLGVIRAAGGGVDALAVSGSSISAVGQVVAVDVDRRRSELSRYWYADFIESRQLNNAAEPLDFCVWSLQLASGKLVCWSVPIVRCLRDIDFLLEQPAGDSHLSVVHPMCMILGYTSSAGNSSTWMQQPSMGPRRVFSLGHVPRSLFGCILGSGQGCRKLHRSLCEDFEHQMFRPDFLDHEMFFPSDYVLSLPSSIPSLFCFLSDTVKEHENPEKDIDGAFRHLYMRTNLSIYRESAAMSLELLLLRVLESMNKSLGPSLLDQSQAARQLFCVLVEALRVHCTPLQFVKVFLEVGRQIEPSYFRFMFPLPVSDPAGGRETTYDLFDLSLEQGALSVAVAFLPLFEDGETIRASCAAVFHHCLVSIVNLLNDPMSYESFSLLLEERATIRDLFRYALKVEDSRGGNSMSDSDDNSAGSWEDGSLSGMQNDKNGDNGYSLMCGFKFGKKKAEERRVLTAASSFISHGTEYGSGKPGAASNELANGLNGHGNTSWKLFDVSMNSVVTVAGIAARFLLSSVFDAEDDGEVARCSRWKKASAVSALLIGENSTGLPLCSRSRFMELLRLTNDEAIIALVVTATRKRRHVGLVEYIVRRIGECQNELGNDKASVVLDLVLILLNRRDVSEDPSLEVPGLLLLTVVVGHVSGRTSTLLTESMAEQHSLINAYLEAAFELANSPQLNAADSP